jgi:urocanate hydratase
VVGSQARILYAGEAVWKSSAFNQAIAKGDIGTIVLGRTITMFPDRLSLQGNIKHLRIAFTADMAIQNVIGDSSVALLGYPFTMAAE